MRTIVYGATGTGTIYFIKQYLKLYLDQEQYQDNNDMIEGHSVLAPDKSKSKDQEQEQEQRRKLKHGWRSVVEHGEAWTKSHDRRSVREPASQMSEHPGTCFEDDRRSKTIVCIDERDLIDPEIGEPL